MKTPSGGSKKPFDVGYGKPPASARFQKGRSGNPKGRPKGSLNLATALNRALSEKVSIIENGRRRSVSKLDAAVKGLVNRAVKGDPRAIHEMLALGPLVGIEPVATTTSSLDQTESEILESLMKRFEAPDEPPATSFNNPDSTQENVP